MTNFISILSNNEASREGSIIIECDNNIKTLNESFDKGCKKCKIENKDKKISYNKTRLKIVEANNEINGNKKEITVNFQGRK